MPAVTPKTNRRTDYQNAVSKLLSLADFERKSRSNDPPDFHLKRITRLLGYLGDPHIGQEFIHIAGSKGKGSTAAMIAWGLSAGGYKVGLFTSPSIFRITERFRIDGIPISEADFTNLVNDLWPAVEKVTADGDIGVVSVFELETAMAFHHFATSNADVSVIEVGLGGRLDSTNVVTPLVSVVTPVSLDHVAILGGTIEKIAVEKAGIIKPGVPVVASPQLSEAQQVIQAKASAEDSELVNSDTAVNILDKTDLGLEGESIQFEIGNIATTVHLRLLGDHQIDNARTALAAINQLKNSGFNIDFDRVAHGISQVDWPARNQLVSLEPTPIFVDGAHNDASAKALRSSVEKLFPGRGEVIVILGTVRGHDPAIVARELLPLRPIFITTESRHPKSLTESELSDALGESKIEVAATTANTQDALVKAKQLAKSSDLILAAGSLFVAAEVVELEHLIEPELYPYINLPPTQEKRKPSNTK
jgi:dihydrofolate synthase/folylpolyglutamate synthase